VKYCNKNVCVCLSAMIYLEPDAQSLQHFLCMLPMDMDQSSSGVTAIHYILPLLWMTSLFFYNGPYSVTNFIMKDRFHLNLLIYRNVGQNSISYY